DLRWRQSAVAARHRRSPVRGRGPDSESGATDGLPTPPRGRRGVQLQPCSRSPARSRRRTGATHHRRQRRRWTVSIVASNVFADRIVRYIEQNPDASAPKVAGRFLIEPTDEQLAFIEST